MPAIGDIAPLPSPLAQVTPTLGIVGARVRARRGRRQAARGNRRPPSAGTRRSRRCRSRRATQAQDWKKMAKAEVNPRWFWIVSAAVLAVFVRSSASSRAGEDRRDAERGARRDARAGGQGSHAGPRGRQAPLRRRQVRREPGEVPPGPDAAAPTTRRRASTPRWPRTRSTATSRSRRGNSRPAQLGRVGAKTALAEGRNEQARAKAEEILALTPSNADALAIRDEADKKIAESEGRRRRQEEGGQGQGAAGRQEEPGRSRPPSRTAATSARLPPPSKSAPPAPVPGNATLRLAFESRRFRKATSWSRSTTRSFCASRSPSRRARAAP